MKDVKLNLNYTVKVKLTDMGIEYYVRNHNETIPFQWHISFQEYKSRADANGYHSYQMHDFMDSFGKLGLSVSNMCDLNIIIPHSSLKELEL